MRSKPLTQCSESELVAVGSEAAGCFWVLGEAASIWCEKYSRGRTQQDYADLTGWSQESVSVSIAVHRKMSPLRERYPTLRYALFKAALNWDDAEHWLEEAAENGWTRERMRAARAESLAPPIDTHAEDDTTEPEFEAPPPRELTQEQLDAVDNTELLKQLRKSLAKYRTKFGKSGWSDMADALAQFEHALRDSLENA